MSDKKTHFGYQQVPETEKATKVAEVFHSVAKNYDIMNDLMSLGTHRLWKRFTIDVAKPHKNDKILDLAGGTGDLAKLFAKRTENQSEIIVSDINDSMLSIGRDRLINAGYFKNIYYVQANAECLPFANDYFNLITIGFGLRNVTHKDKALAEMHRVLKPGGKAIILEFSKPTIEPVNKIYDFYSFKILPKIGKLVAKDEASYQYLSESIRMHPDQVTLQSMMEKVGFEDVAYHNLSAGIVAVHIGHKY
ncbi:MAG: bifunctional demethylmenaquinone methyltransferase/2-methoxy-6-polyprenyl-1,4-benzoquinol methylase UbiE [Legionellales bacterium]|nr:bifunctional demethylmenaquinone methyltransferase/2-methoxy-6-polyprenyl-1,4-benzoquinol methylase UbiE [Legionellales bacterium]